MDLEELKKMKESMETAARDVEQSVQTTASEFEKDWAETTSGLVSDLPALEPPPPEYKHPDKNWRLKRGAMPQWYKACLLYTSQSPRDVEESRMPSSA